MRNIKNLIFIVILTLFNISCMHSHQLLLTHTPSKMYFLAHQKLKSNQFEVAITELKNFKKLYPFNHYLKNVELDLIYAYYKNGNNYQSQRLIKNFIKLYPNDLNIDFCIYTNGLIEMQYFSTSFLEKIFNINSYDRDIIRLQKAEKNFSDLLYYYPNSKYSFNAKKNLKIVQEKLAQHELSIANFYNDHHNDVAFINRVKLMLKKYPNTKIAQKVLNSMNNVNYSRRNKN